MNGYPFAGPGGQKTLHRRAAEAVPERHGSDAFAVACANLLAKYVPPHEVYNALMEYDNR